MWESISTTSIKKVPMTTSSASGHRDALTLARPRLLLLLGERKDNLRDRLGAEKGKTRSAFF